MFLIIKSNLGFEINYMTSSCSNIIKLNEAINSIV